MLVPTLASFMKTTEFLFQEERTGNDRESCLTHMSFFTIAEMVALLDIFPANWRLEFSLLGSFTNWRARKRGRSNWWRLRGLGRL
jgi:hypothetical protein